MRGLLVKPALREAVGESAAKELSDMFADAHALATESYERRLDASTTSFERRLASVSESFERRLGEEVGKVRVDIANLKFEMVKWSFLFWIGQVAVLTAVLSALFGRLH